MKLPQAHTKNRLLLGLIAVFFAVCCVYLLAYFVFQPLAVPVTLGFCTSVLIFFFHRWRIYPREYDKEINELHDLLNIMPLMAGSYLPFGVWALRPESLTSILTHILTNSCHEIVECGSGISTLTIARLLKQIGHGHLFSIEEDENWYQRMIQLIEYNELSDWVTLVRAPLAPSQAWGVSWYSLDGLEPVLDAITHIDLLLVDGPKAAEDSSRFPAVPFFREKMDSDTLIILDDIHRKAEKAVLQSWEDHYQVRVCKQTESTRPQAYIRPIAMTAD